MIKIESERMERGKKKKVFECKHDDKEKSSSTFDAKCVEEAGGGKRDGEREREMKKLKEEMSVRDGEMERE